MTKKYKTLRLILGDQLNANHSWYRTSSNDVLYLIAELKQEATYVKHHIQKLCAFFNAMEQFANALKASGHQLLHLNLEQTKQYQNLPNLLESLCQQYQIESLEYQQPDEYRLHRQLHNLTIQNSVTKTPVKIRCYDSEHFYLAPHEFKDYIKPNHHNRMESFYRKMRARFNILMKNDKPEGGRWNFDTQNRNKLTQQDLSEIPQPKIFTTDIQNIKQRIDKHKIPYFGHIDETLLWPSNRKQAYQLLEHFCKYCLPHFGTFQDAMTQNHEAAWTLYHSRLSFALNSKILSPRTVINRAIEAYRADPTIDIAQVEGFVRQILGWREYVRAVYWQNQDAYSSANFLKAKAKLPDYFWHGKTRMNCMSHAIKQSLDFAYAHHIQRLMITGNFCLLTGIDPAHVDEWYLGIYIDAIEWVEMPNTRGMSQFADGGWVATKPYCSSGNYINKMSDYCKDCHYDVKARTSADACPFNSLYWNFLDKHKDKLAKNPRLSMPYRNWNKMNQDMQTDIIDKAQDLMLHIEEL
ncbi:cryptochrome/photolyase family protein [Kangiella sp. TOML190]|uniref:cryptochrome/photolyase family protein n=1 Tax=Kangiella sp. TOML190 TaxID=2931351 RepID=UPI00203CDDCC|nr:cryptochrome/photolyase family protein [Kangiella sp. TOML190]